MDDIIAIRNLTKRYGDVTAVDDVSLHVARGELFGLLGPNGSGKTTMNKLLTGQIPPTGGSLRVLGTDVVASPVEVRRQVGIIPEQETPPSFLTAEEYLHFVGRIRGIEDPASEADRWFGRLDFEDKRRVLCKDLSRGTRQKLMFAQAFLHHPPVAFIDEPLINLDPIMQRRVKDFLTGYVREGGTVFFSTHILAIAGEICTRIGIIHKGRLLYTGPVDTLVEDGRQLEEAFLALVEEGQDG
jgi:ABC-2 type transport system ATP-binding protein